ncbi:SusC/RagA family TonB-linked outer membrane protein [Phaeodactylibacter xiamenensis]|uniref:SusC/RagA family TonB-linked outer membrane protein n=1 Tax=Phaeodactylibacter xiamenensis TaxID=1524460 RepID=UPI0024A8587F|nr:TonB-dependent receptor [Phaeodactylibacter xiamenensis]
MKQNTILYQFVILVLLMLASAHLNAQTRISGVITDADSGDPLIGANVLVVGTANGTIADINGAYVLVVSDTARQLRFSYTGYADQTINIDGKTVIDIALTSGETLEEVVVVGYGRQSKAKLTSAVSTVDEETLKKLPVANVSNGLEGLAAGLFVRQGSGEPGFSGSSFEVRNFGSALVIVDGSPGNIDELAPNEIESITVLKDAAAASVYGVQGGNGVVLVTTRRGTMGKPKLSYDNQFTFTSFTSYPDFLNSAQRATVLNEGLLNAGQAPFYTEDEVETFRSGSDPINYPDTDWKALMFNDYGFQQRHNLNLNGGSEKVRYFVSASFLDQGSNYTEDVLGYQQFNLRSNINANITDNLILDFRLAGRRRLNEAPAYSAFNIFRELSRALPTDLAYYPDGTPARPSFSPNHILEGIRDFNAGYYRARNNNIDTKLSLQWDVNQVPGLSIKSYGSLVYNTNFAKEWGKSYELYTLNRQTGEYDAFTASPEGSFSETVLTQSTGFNNHYVVQQSINYDRQFGQHSVSALLLGELQNNSGQNFFGRRQDFQSTLIDQLFAGSNENKDANGGEYRENRLGLVGRLSYDYKAKYLIESSFRYDGSSRFAPGREWGFFPSVSAGWRLSEEGFFDGARGVIQNLKLRASVGTAGNDGTGAYQWLSGFVYDGFFAINETAIPTINNTALPNEDLTWETLTTYDVGFDAAFLDNSLTVSFDYFYRDRTDVLAFASGSVPSTLGVGLAAQNLHAYSNEGFEVSLNYNKKVNRDLTLGAMLNFSRARETAVFIDEAFFEDPFMRQNLTVTGGYTNLRRGYISDGLFQTQEEINQSPIQDGNENNSLQPGDVKYVDLNGDNIIDVRDQKVFGDGDKPTLNYSFNLSAEYKNFAISALFTGAAGYDIYIDGEAQSPLRNGFNGYTYQMDYWTPENTGAAYPRITDGGFNDNNYRYSDFWMRDGRHLRLRNINLSYAIPGTLLTRMRAFEEIRLFLTGHNLFVLKNFEEEFDPQMQSSVGWYYPQLRSFTCGINLTL